jgi:hypothetical protein
MKTAEEILSVIIPNDDYWTEIFPKVIKAMEEYASLPAKSATDEDIEEWAYSMSSDYSVASRLITGAKAMRDGLIKKV